MFGIGKDKVIEHLERHIDRLERTIDRLMEERMYYLGKGDVPAQLTDSTESPSRDLVPQYPDAGTVVSNFNKVS